MGAAVEFTQVPAKYHKYHEVYNVGESLAEGEEFSVWRWMRGCPTSDRKDVWHIFFFSTCGTEAATHWQISDWSISESIFIWVNGCGPGSINKQIKSQIQCSEELVEKSTWLLWLCSVLFSIEVECWKQVTPKKKTLILVVFLCSRMAQTHQMCLQSGPAPLQHGAAWGRVSGTGNCALKPPKNSQCL